MLRISMTVVNHAQMRIEVTNQEPKNTMLGEQWILLFFKSRMATTGVELKFKMVDP